MYVCHSKSSPKGVTVDTYAVSALILNIEFRPIFATLLE